MPQINARVLLKEPRGFIRLLQIVFGLLACSTTAGFSTISTLNIYCAQESALPIEYKVAYPFDLRETEVLAPANCSDDTKLLPEKFPIDFSFTSMLYKVVCMYSILYATGAAIYYCLFTQKYETNPLAPMVDLCLTLLFTIFWIFITCLWALNVSDLKYYTNPHYFRDFLGVCLDSDANCQPGSPGKWTSLTVSIVCGFTSVLLWLGSTWYIFKETTLHKKQAYQNPATN